MAWQLTDDVTVGIERVWPLLVADPVGHTLAVTVIEDIRVGRRWSDEPMLFGWYQVGPEVSGAVLRTPPHELLLAVVPDGLVEHQRLYALGTLRPPTPLPAGGARLAGSEDLDPVLGWFVAFHQAPSGGGWFRQVNVESMPSASQWR